MKKRGFSFVEVVIGMAIILVIAEISLEMYISNYRNYLKLSSYVDENTNLRIALEYIADEIINSKNVKLVKINENIHTFVDEINVNSEVWQPKQYLLIDDKKIYIVNNIIRFNQNSNHVVSNIKSFSIKKNELMLYTITVNSKSLSLKTNVYKRE